MVVLKLLTEPMHMETQRAISAVVKFHLTMSTKTEASSVAQDANMTYAPLVHQSPLMLKVRNLKTNLSTLNSP